MSEFYNLKKTIGMGRSSSTIQGNTSEHNQLNYGIIRTTVAKDLFNVNVHRKKPKDSPDKLGKRSMQ